MLSPALIRDEVIEVREPRQKRLLTATGMVKSFHGEPLGVSHLLHTKRPSHLRTLLDKLGRSIYSSL
jgi:hypothetical protein